MALEKDLRAALEAALTAQRQNSLAEREHMDRARELVAQWGSLRLVERWAALDAQPLPRDRYDTDTMEANRARREELLRFTLSVLDAVHGPPEG